MATSSSSPKVLVACTGSVATVKLVSLLQEIAKLDPGVEIKVVLTENAKHFVDISSLDVPVLTDADEWKTWHKLGDPVVHIELRRWADVMVIAPLSANTLAKLACGLCDNLLTCVARAWDVSKPLLFAPAMNTHMYDHPITQQQIAMLKSWGYIEVPAIVKKLACGDLGCGAMAEPNAIAAAVIRELITLHSKRLSSPDDT